jgi:hypothetical protein
MSLIETFLRETFERLETDLPSLRGRYRESPSSTSTTVREVVVRACRVNDAMRRKSKVLLVVVLLFLQRAASAVDWGYCFAPSEENKRIYISPVFPVMGSQPETSFRAGLAKRNLSNDVAECARADDESTAVIMRQYAIDVNRKWGRRVIETQWRPSR